MSPRDVIPGVSVDVPRRMTAVGSGTVLDGGAGIALYLRVGDKVLLLRYSGTDIRIDGVEVLVLGKDDHLASHDLEAVTKPVRASGGGSASS